MSTWKITPSMMEPGASCLLGPYDEDFVAALKEAIPDSGRKILRDRAGAFSAWLIRDDYRPHAQRVIDKFTPGVSPDPTPLTPEELVEAAKGMGVDVTHDHMSEGLLMGVAEVYGRHELREFIAVEVGGRLLVVAVIEVGNV